MKIIVPLLLLLIGTGAGVGAGIMLAPTPPPEEPCMGEDCEPEETAAEEEDAAPEASDLEYVRLRNQFIVPVVRDERVSSVVIMSVSLETDIGSQEVVYAREPKLRDVFLAVMFDHAFMGGFDGPFTDSERMKILKNSLAEVARTVLGDTVHSVLITDIARQEM